MRVEHTFLPVFNEESRILVLGTLPSVKSRENAFYYGHPRNRFWPLLSELFGWERPESIEDKKAMLYANRVAIWDVIAACEIQGSSDSSIKDVIPNDLSVILKQAQIKKIFGNGDTACNLYRRYCLEQTGIEIQKLPSTSPANAACSFPALLACWKEAFSQVEE